MGCGAVVLGEWVVGFGDVFWVCDFGFWSGVVGVWFCLLGLLGLVFDGDGWVM